METELTALFEKVLPDASRRSEIPITSVNIEHSLEKGYATLPCPLDNFALKNEERKLGTAFDRLLNYTFKEDEDMDTQLLDLADIVIANRPLLANFEQIKSIGEVNHAVSFLSGVVYALNGEVYCLGDETRLFATGKAFEDGSLQRYVKDFAVNR